jgi:hypothetical protein
MKMLMGIILSIQSIYCLNVFAGTEPDFKNHCIAASALNSELEVTFTSIIVDEDIKFFDMKATSILTLHDGTKVKNLIATPSGCDLESNGLFGCAGGGESTYTSYDGNKPNKPIPVEIWVIGQNFNYNGTIVPTISIEAQPLIVNGGTTMGDDSVSLFSHTYICDKPWPTF